MKCKFQYGVRLRQWKICYSWVFFLWEFTSGLTETVTMHCPGTYRNCINSRIMQKAGMQCIGFCHSYVVLCLSNGLDSQGSVRDSITYCCLLHLIQTNTDPSNSPYFDSIEITNKMQPCNRIYYSTVHWRLNMFRAAYRPSSGALTVFAAS
jgi:hypothetical protein